MKQKVIEALKTVLLIVLACSAAYLTFLVNRYYDLRLPFLSSVSVEASGEISGDDTVSEAARPIKMAVTNEYGRYAALYDDDAVGQLYDKLGRYLGEALGTIGQSEPADNETISAALTGEGVFYQFPGQTPMSALALWLGAGLPPDAEDRYADMFVISMSEDGNTLCYRTENQWYACQIDLRSDPKADLETYRPNNTYFAFELAAGSDAYEDIDSFCLIASRPTLPKLAATVVTSSLRVTVASGLGFNPYSDTSYVEDDGTEVFTANSSMLRLGSDGLLTFNAPAGDAASPTAAERIELGRKTLQALISPGDAKLYFSGESFVGGDYILTFDYYISGARIAVMGQPAATVTISGGSVTEISLWLKSYEKTEGYFELLPATQAAAMTGGELVAAYTDSGAASPTADWQKTS